MKETIIDLIRHGEPRGGRVYRGHTIDDPLTDKGWLQMWESLGDHSPWQHIVTSPLKRCHEFALALGQRDAIGVTIENNLKEIGFGVWEGKTPEQLQADNPLDYNKFYLDPVNNRPDNAESIADFSRRVTLGYDKVLADNPGRQILIVCHAGVIRAIIASVLYAAPLGLYKIKVNNGGVTRIRHGQYGGILDFHNKKLSD